MSDGQDDQVGDIVDALDAALQTKDTLRKALGLIAALGGKTLIAPSMGPDADMAYQLGAAAAFEQAADIARDAIEQDIGR